MISKNLQTISAMNRGEWNTMEFVLNLYRFRKKDYGSTCKRIEISETNAQLIILPLYVSNETEIDTFITVNRNVKRVSSLKH